MKNRHSKWPMFVLVALAALSTYLAVTGPASPADDAWPSPPPVSAKPVAST
jgi:hypothetical protein